MLSAELVAAAVRHNQGGSTADDQAALNEVGFTPLHGGRNNGVFRLNWGDGMLCMKIYRSDGRQRGKREWDTLHFLAEHHIPFVPKTFQLVHIDGIDVVVMQFVEGSNLGYKPLNEKQLETLAAHTQQLQRLPCDDTRIPRVVPAIERIDAIRSFLDKATAPDPETATCLHTMKHWVQGADPVILLQPVDRVFSRLDTSLANAIWDDPKLTLIDFEYSGWTEQAFDLAELIEHVQSRGTSDGSWERFVRIFDFSPRVREQVLPARRLIAIEWVQRFWPTGDSPPSEQLSGQIDRVLQLCGNSL